MQLLQRRCTFLRKVLVPLFKTQHSFPIFKCEIMASSTNFHQRKQRVLSFTGAMVAPVTLFDAANTFEINKDYDALKAYLSYLVSLGSTGLWVHGTTGEGLSLTHEEKKQLTRNWCRAKKELAPDVTLVINVTSTCLKDTLDHVSLCQSLPEVDAVAVLPSFYYRPADIKELVDYVKLVASPAPELPLIFYFNPEKTCVTLSMLDFVSSAIKEVPTFVGIKYAGKNIGELAAIQRIHGKSILVMVAGGEIMLAAAVNGVKTGNSALFNTKEVTESFLNIQKELKEGQDGFLERAQEEQKIIQDIQTQLYTGPFLANLKNLLQKRVNFPVGKVRPPIVFE